MALSDDETTLHAGNTSCGIPKYSHAELVVSEDILAKAKELADLISTSEEVRIYREAERKIQNHPRIQEMIRLIKKKQKEAVAFEKVFRNEEMVRKIEAEIAALQDELDAIPLVQQFQQTQHDLNLLLQLVVDVIRDTVSEKIELERGDGVAPSGCGG